MPHATGNHPLVVAALLLVAGLTVACESDVERQMRLEREALEASGELEELEEQLNTTNPDPYDPETTGTINRGRFRQN